MTQPDPAAHFVRAMGAQPDRRGDVPLHRGRAAGVLPDPRWDGPTHYRPQPPRPLLDRVLDYIAGYAPTMRVREFGPLINDHAAVPDDVESEDWNCGRHVSRGMLAASLIGMAGAALAVAALVAL